MLRRQRNTDIPTNLQREQRGRDSGTKNGEHRISHHEVGLFQFGGQMTLSPGF